ncbi:hypothetical protein B0H11DRAFT_2013032 [Mycena galericulata]|nr:hypothetical protein B0H11DRAFT_2013032 [Mycena galericulata]
MLLDHPEYSLAVSRVLASFDLQSLEDEATRVMKKGCIGSYPIAQGGFNTVFVLTFEDGTDVIARLARSAFNDNAECTEDGLTHSFFSEVATLAFVKHHTSIPVPEVYHVESSAGNPVGARYILMEQILGHPLGTTWYTMSSQQRQQVVTQLAVGIIDWEGSRIYPLWNSSRYATYLRGPNVLDDESEVESLRQLQKDIIERKTEKKYPSSSPLRLGTLLYMVDYTHSVRSSRAYMDHFFLAWFNVLTRIGYVRELEPFLALKHFIEVGRLY